MGVNCSFPTAGALRSNRRLLPCSCTTGTRYGQNSATEASSWGCWTLWLVLKASSRLLFTLAAIQSTNTPPPSRPPMQTEDGLMYVMPSCKFSPSRELCAQSFFFVFFFRRGLKTEPITAKEIRPLKAKGWNYIVSVKIGHVANLLTVSFQPRRLLH